MRKRLVLFNNWVDPAASQVLGRQPDIEVVCLQQCSPTSDNERELSLAHGYHILPRTELRSPWFADAALISRCPQLLAVCSTGAGFDVINVEACTEAGIIVCNQSGSNKEAVAEHALGLMLSLAKKIAVTDRDIRRVKGLARFSYTGVELAGKTVGIIGIGQIGTRTAELCRAFGMKVIACDPYLSAAQVEARGAEKVDLERLLSSSYFVSVHCPRNAETFGMINEHAFGLMHSNAFFINTARGGIHDEQALYEAMKARCIAGAAVDVFVEEPPSLDHPLLSLDNVIATPHIAGITVEALRGMATATAEQWIAIFEGRRPPRLINAEAWPRYRERFASILGSWPENAAER